MTPFPQFLYARSNAVIERQVFIDLRLSAVLSEETLEILAHPVSSDEIASRQAVFLRLEDEAFCVRFDACRSSLLDLKKALELYGDSVVPLQKYHLFALLLQAHFDAVAHLSQLDGGPWCEEIGSYCKDWLQSEQAEKQRNDLAVVSEILAKIRKTHIQFGFKSYLCYPQQTSGYVGQIDGWAAEWGYDLPKEAGTRLSPGEELSDAYARLFDAEFAKLRTILSDYESVLFEAPIDLIGQMDFYLEIHGLVKRAQTVGLPVCCPNISKIRLVDLKNAWDLTLLQNGQPVVTNDVQFDEQTPFYFLLGANGGGKTTYLRALAINLIFFSAGCPIFAESGRMYPFAKIKTHFPRDERFSFVGRLDEEYARSEKLLVSADADSFFLYNETFSGTDEEKGLSHTLDAAEKMEKAGAFGLYVTHFHGVESRSYPILSAIVGEGGERTYRIVPKSAGGSSFAADILKKYKLDPVSLGERTVPKE